MKLKKKKKKKKNKKKTWMERRGFRWCLKVMTVLINSVRVC